MAAPLFNPGFAFDPEEMIRRLGQTSDPLGIGQSSPFNRQTQGGLLSGLNFAELVGGDGVRKLIEDQPGAKSAAPTAAPPTAAPPAKPKAPAGPGAFGSMLDAGADFLRQSQGSGPPQASPFQAAPPGQFSPVAAPQMPGFSPAAPPEKTPFAPVQVDGAIRTGMFNPAGNSPWDRSLTANSAEEELRLRQDAKYNAVLDMIRPGGIGMPGTTGPIIGLQPWELQAMASLGGRQANDLTQGRQIASQESVAADDRVLKALMGNQQAQTQRDIASLETQGRTGVANLDAQTKRDVATIEAGSRNNPNTIKAQFAAQFLGSGGSPQQLGGMLHSLQQHLGPTGSPASPPQPGMPTPQEEVSAMGAVNNLAAMMGKGQPGPQFQPNELNPMEAGKVLDFVAGLKTPGEQNAVLRELMSGRLGNQMAIRDNIIRAGAGAHYQVSPPIDPRTGKPAFLDDPKNAPPYVVNDAETGSELFRYQTNPQSNAVRAALGSMYGQLPYSQVALPNGMGVVDIPDSLMNPSAFATKLPRQTLENRARLSQQLLRQLMSEQRK